MVPEAPEQEVAAYRRRSLQYWKQALEYVKGREWTKVTELAWGSVVEAAQALALSRGVKLRTHREVKDYLRRLATETGDQGLYRLFQRMEAAHANFYQEFMTPDEVREVLLEADNLLEKLHQLIPGQAARKRGRPGLHPINSGPREG